MAWTSVNPVTIGNPTKKSDYDKVWDNVVILGGLSPVWVYLNAAPTGYTIVVAAADALLAVKGGAQAYNANGGTQQGTWTQPDHLHTTPDFTLTTNEMPAHTHTANGIVVGTGAWAGGGAEQSGQVTTSSTGTGAAHNHGNTGNSATAITWRPLAQVGIIVSRD